MGKPCYYSILPANIRYDNELSDKAKLLFSEITALANASGECYASNEYFMKLYNLSETTIHRIIRQLKIKEYIDIEYVYKPNSKEIKKRIIKVVSKLTPRGAKNDRENNIKKYNNTNVLLYKEKSKNYNFKPPTLEQIQEYARERNLTHVDCEYFYNYFNDSNWVDSKGRKVRSWKQTILSWNKHEKRQEEQRIIEQKKKDERNNENSRYPRL